MPYPAILRDTNGDPIPQYFNTATTTWVPLTEAEITALAEVDISDDATRVLGQVALTGSTVVIDGTTYQLTDGAVLRGTNAIKPTAALAHAAIPYCYYFAIDTGVVEATDGTNWVVI